MKLSIITPTYNSESTIGRNILSVLSQTVKDFEHILVDNKSRDNTLRTAEELYKKHNIRDKLKVISEKDNGISDAFNKGIKAAAGDIVAILNSDDIYYNNQVFERVLSAFQNPEILFVHGDIYFDDPVYGSNIRKPLLCPVTSAMPYNHPTMFFRKNVYEQFGLFDTSFKYAMDHELIIRYEKLIRNFGEKGRYLNGESVGIMYAGGASWQNELKAVKESRRALKMHGFWNYDARKNYLLRVSRIRIKEYLNKMNLNVLVKIWRKGKWG
ncbi:MAG: glycosyltransferase family 2 protein [Ignavibacteriaceae bacterium]